MTTETENFVRYETSGPVATITLARPEKLNALTMPMHRSFTAAVRRFDADKSTDSIRHAAHR